ncbi:MAG: U32 family peptidase [Bacteroidetes bacterium]|nr:U32 family peptidase [Bacteroidota bacterium]
MKREDIEISSPVGSYESLMAAIQGGADSVYFGVQHLNMRARSSNNFSIEDLHNIVGIARKNRIKAYLTLNTVIYDNEAAQMRKIADAASEAGISAVIATDHSVLEYAHRKGMELHLSTQINISNYEALKFYAWYADVVVLARELTLDQVGYITQRIREEQLKGPSGKLIRIEIFVHGALCMAISGKCYMSLHESNHSANRGSCLQTCRKGYIVTEKESGYRMEIDNEYIMSPKDLCTIHFLNKILDAGVTVLKIEGRARSPEYVKTVTQCYREAVDAYFDGTYTEERILQWQEKLRTVFNRDFWDGYYLGQKLGEWSHRYGSRATKRKVYLGKVTNFFTKIGVAEITLETGDLLPGDEYLITGPTSGVVEGVIAELRVNEKPAEIAQKGEKCSIPLSALVRRSDKFYKVVAADEVRQQ